MKILFLVPYPLGQAPSQRFRFEQYLELLQEAGHILRFSPFLDQSTWRKLYQSGGTLQKLGGVLRGLFRRFEDMIVASQYDIVFIHREAAPIGPPLFEWFLAKILRKRLIYDFDDAIWMANTSKENRVAATFKNHSKVSSICSWSWRISCGNQFLCDYASRFNAQVVLNPTTIDTINYHVKTKRAETGKLTIGWTGSHSTIKYLENLVPVLRQLESEIEYRLLVISNHQPNFELSSMEFRAWNKASEVADLMEMDIGLMPLSDDPWAKGKCGFKSLQYMSLEIPALVSPVGVNVKIVQDGVNGFHCQSDIEWKENIKRLADSPSEREKMGAAGRRLVIEQYSVVSNQENFLRLFTDSEDR